MSAAEIGRRRISSRKQRRFALIAVALAMLGLAVGLALYALSGSIVFFRTPRRRAGQGGQRRSRRRHHQLRHHRYGE
jgi:cytochrome c-type biogenesis protein CcmE